MANYIARRIIQIGVMLFFLSFVCYALLGLMPGDPVDILISSDPNITTADIERLKRIYGLDQPIYKRYFHWLGDILSGNLGYSRTYKVPTAQIIGPRLLNTFVLAASSFFLSILIAIPLGMIAAFKKGSKFDYYLNLLAFTGISTPSFFLGIVLIILFSVNLQWLPAGGTYTIEVEGQSFFAMLMDRIKYLILPTLSLMFLQLGIFVRYTRSAIIEVMGKDYIKTAKAKGLKPKTVIVMHALRNALIPIVTICSLSFGTVFSGAIITETIFAYQGVGKLLFDSMMGNDYNVAMIALIISTAMVLTMSFVADVLYAVVDPRISYK